MNHLEAPAKREHRAFRDQGGVELDTSDHVYPVQVGILSIAVDPDKP